MGAAKHLLRYLTRSTDFSITYKQGGFKLEAFSDANWEENPNSWKSTSSCIIMLSNDPISSKVGIQGRTAQSTMETELLVAALTMKEAVFCSNTMLKLGFKERSGSVPLTSTTHRHFTSPATAHTALARSTSR